jgi:hypothetical protein
MTYCPRFIHTLYCDDVRHEVGGKMTFVGAYQGQMVAEQPGELMLPKLCIVLTAQTPHSQPFQRLNVKLFRDDEVLQEMELPIQTLHLKDVANGRPLNFDVMGVIMTLHGLKFEKDSTLRVRVQTESEELSAMGLQVVLKDTSQTAIETSIS